MKSLHVFTGFRVLVACMLVMLVGGCFINTRPRASRLPSYDGSEQTSLTASSSTETVATATAVTPPPPAAIPPMPPPAPPRYEQRLVGPRFTVSPAQLQAPDIMSVKVTNTSPYFACLVSPTFGHGEPIFKLRHGSYEQDFLPSHPGWSQVACAAVLMPNETQNTEDGPEAWLAVNRVGTFNLVVKLYTYDGVDPQYTGITIQQKLVFPNTWRKNPHCPQWYGKGCLHNYPIRASIESDSSGNFQMALYGDTLGVGGEVFSQRLIVDEANQYLALGELITHDHPSWAFAQR